MIYISPTIHSLLPSPQSVKLLPAVNFWFMIGVLIVFSLYFIYRAYQKLVLSRVMNVAIMDL